VKSGVGLGRNCFRLASLDARSFGEVRPTRRGFHRLVRGLLASRLTHLLHVLVDREAEIRFAEVHSDQRSTRVHRDSWVVHDVAAQTIGGRVGGEVEHHPEIFAVLRVEDDLLRENPTDSNGVALLEHGPSLRPITVQVAHARAVVGMAMLIVAEPIVHIEDLVAMADADASLIWQMFDEHLKVEVVPIMHVDGSVGFARNGCVRGGVLTDMLKKKSVGRCRYDM